MILRVILKNFLSFNDEVQFDMFPNMKRTTLSNHITMLDGKLPVLKMAAVYGANGAGKSNLLKGINFLKAIATNKNFLNGDSVGRYMFALKEDAGDESIELTIEFATKSGIPFIYSVEIAKTGITFETLQVSGLGAEENKNIFTRKDGAVEYSIAPSAEVNKMVLGWIEKNPFASLLTINNDMPVLADANIDIAQKWFDDELTIIGLHSFNPALIGIFRNDENINKFASELFKAIDLGIDGVKVETENFEDWISTHDVSNLPVDKLRKMHSGVLRLLISEIPEISVLKMECRR